MDGTSIADGSGSNFIARDNEFIDTIYGNTGSFIGPNTLLFREEYPFGNIINTPSASNVEFTSGSVFSGSVSLLVILVVKMHNILLKEQIKLG